MSTETSIIKALSTIAPHLAKGGTAIEGLKRLSGGASQETWKFKVKSHGDTHIPLILRRAPGGTRREGTGTGAIPLALEAGLLQAAGKHGVPVPNVIWTAPDGHPLGNGFIMSCVTGETIARKLLRDACFASARKAFAKDAGKALAKLHQVPSSTLPALETSDGLGQLATYETIYRALSIERPIFDLTFQHLRITAPRPLKPCLVHGDFRLGNLMLDDTGLTAVLDWELAHFGDPREDLGWICVNSWRFGHVDKRVAGLTNLPAFLSAYAAAGGVEVPPKDIAWWETLGSLKWGIMCLIMYDSWRAGLEKTVERAAIGRRVSEVENDLLVLLESL